jgi:uncharacterized protein YqgC (DUF456 family)
VVYVSAVVLTVLNLVFWVGILFNLPGTWLMVLVTALLKWWLPAYVRVSWTMLGVAAGLAVLGEVLEFVLGAAGSRQAGGSTRAAALAIVGSLVGGIIGTAIPVPVVGTLIGACLGAFAGSLIGDLWAGRPLVPQRRGGLGSGRGPVLGDHDQTRRRRRHGGYPGAGGVLLMGLDRVLYAPKPQACDACAGVDEDGHLSRPRAGPTYREWGSRVAIRQR